MSEFWRFCIRKRAGKTALITTPPVYTCQAVSPSELWVQAWARICALTYAQAHMKASVSIPEPRQNNRHRRSFLLVWYMWHAALTACFVSFGFFVSVCHELLFSVLCCLTCGRTRCHSREPNQWERAFFTRQLALARVSVFLMFHKHTGIHSNIPTNFFLTSYGLLFIFCAAVELQDPTGSLSTLDTYSDSNCSLLHTKPV